MSRRRGGPGPAARSSAALLPRRPAPEDRAPTAGAYDVRLPLAGAFQASNALVAAGLCIAAGESAERGAGRRWRRSRARPAGCSGSAPGPRGGEAYVDYAHTPDGLETVLHGAAPARRAAG